MKNILFYMLLLLTGAVHAQTAGKNFIVSRLNKNLDANANNIGEVNIQVQYFDGLGRPLQTIAVGQSTEGTDLITHTDYDAYGRQTKNYLPYAGGLNGAYDAAAISGTNNQGNFYINNVAGLEGSDLARPYSENYLENSPLNRPTGSRAPGSKSADASIAYSANAANEVKKYIYTSNANLYLTISQSGFYDAGTLYRNQTIDENAKTAIEYTDLEGRLISKSLGGLTTHWVYDNLGLLRAVLQPKFQDNALLYENAFVYNYDDRGRVTVKKVPGAGKVEMVYDKFDRLAMSQDSGQLVRHFWGFTKYDALNRVVMTGEKFSTDSRTVWQAAVNASTIHHELRTSSGVGYGNVTIPSVAATDVFLVNYFDNYSFPSSFAYAGVYGLVNNDNVLSLQTGSAFRMLSGGNNLLSNTIRYDPEYRAIESIRQLYDLGETATELVSTKYKYSLVPVVEEEKIIQSLTGAATARQNNLIDPDQTVDASGIVNTLTNTFTYDHADRLLSIKNKLQLNDKIHEATTLAQRYNILGQLQEKWFHSSGGTGFRRKTSYTNNIRGWQTEGKTTFLKIYTDTQDSTLFSYKLSYGASTYTNGNISQMTWRRELSDFKFRGLTFTYDEVNRLTGSSAVGIYTDTENATYDKNGNFLTLLRAGSAVDKLSYTYNKTGNRLESVNDGSTSNLGVKVGLSPFTYDANGNLIQDGIRGASLTYNYLNLPKTITVGSDIYNYDYDGSGIKHKFSKSLSTTSTTKYAGAFEYADDKTLQRLSFSDGFAKLVGGSIEFNYFIKDHLGNVRVVFNEQGGILQKTDYYPFGLEIDRNSPIQTPAARNGINRYTFQGQERQIGSDYVQFKWRLHDPLTGRFLSVDPLGENFHFNSTYAFAENRVINGIELEGLEWENFMSKFKKPNQLAVKPIPSGQGVQNQSYQVVIQNPKKGLSDLRSTFRDSPQKILSNSKADFQPVDGEGNRLEKADLKKGSYLEIGIAGPMNNSLVKVTDEDNSDNKFSYTFRTLEGHIEAGQITFLASKDKNGNITFGINSTSKVDMGMAPEGFSRNQQAKSWQEVLTNAVKYLQGTETEREVKTKEQK